MRKKLPDILEAGRALDGQFGTAKGDPYGVFKVRCPMTTTWLQIVAGDATAWQAEGRHDLPWEHVSVSTVQRIPTWEEMQWVKELFWDDEECVVQYHPPKSHYVNDNPHVLHLWRPVGVSIPMPPLECV